MSVDDQWEPEHDYTCTCWTCTPELNRWHQRQWDKELVLVSQSTWWNPLTWFKAGVWMTRKEIREGKTR